jgi:hypothetical protein
MLSESNVCVLAVLTTLLADKSWQKILLADLFWEKNIIEELTNSDYQYNIDIPVTKLNRCMIRISYSLKKN